MTKTLIVIVLAVVLVVILAAAYVFAMVWWQSRKQPPSYGLIEQKYYVCRAYRNLSGGIFGKGPTKEFSGKDGREWCWRDEWEVIDRKTFKRLAVDWYGVDWSNEIPFWQGD